MAGEVALAVLLAITAGLLTRSFQHLTDLSPGFRAERVMTARVSPPAASYADRARTSALYSTLTARLAATPGVTSVGLVDRLPIAEPIYGLGLRVQGQFEDATHELPTASHMQAVTPGYFSALGIPIIGGRLSPTPIAKARPGGDRLGRARATILAERRRRRKTDRISIRQSVDHDRRRRP